MRTNTPLVTWSLMQLASLSANMDAASTASKLAIIAPQNIAFGLGRMYAIHGELDARSRKQVEVFRSAEEALAFLGAKEPN